MKKDHSSEYSLLLSHLCKVEAPTTLSSTIVSKIHYLECRKARIRFVSMSSLALISCAAAVPAIISIVKDLRNSGAYEYISLLTSDGGMISNFWKELSLSVIESFPFVGAIALLAAVALFLWAGANALRDAKVALNTI